MKEKEANCIQHACDTLRAKSTSDKIDIIMYVLTIKHNRKIVCYVKQLYMYIRNICKM